MNLSDLLSGEKGLDELTSDGGVKGFGLLVELLLGDEAGGGIVIELGEQFHFPLGVVDNYCYVSSYW